MPVLNVQLSAQGTTSAGGRVALPPAAALTHRGPVVQVSLSVSQAIAKQVLQNGGTLPPPVSGLALLDTGAGATCIDEAAAVALQLPVIDVVRVASASHSSSPQNVYPIQIEVVGLPLPSTRREPSERR